MDPFALIEDALYRAGLGAMRGLCGLAPHVQGTGGERIAWLERPGPGETIVLLHGFASNKDCWLGFVRHLPRRYRVLAFDLPGHGDSGFDAAARHDAASVARRLAAFMEQRGPARFHLLGSSFGGLVATLYAARAPQRVSTLGLIDPLGVYPPRPSELQRLLQQGDNPLIVDSRADFERLLRFVFHRQPFLPWPARHALARMQVRRAALNRSIWADLHGRLEEVVDLLPRLRMPVFLLWGTHDRVLEVSSVQIYQEHVPDLDVVLLADCGHSPMQERPADSARCYTAFLDRARASRPRPAARDAAVPEASGQT